MIWNQDVWCTWIRVARVQVISWYPDKVSKSFFPNCWCDEHQSRGPRIKVHSRILKRLRLPRLKNHHPKNNYLLNSVSYELVQKKTKKNSWQVIFAWQFIASFFFTTNGKVNQANRDFLEEISQPWKPWPL